mmetsp:Transcript_81709/g.231605  ORF Transcript_81709/g.231605 Transcript_81709/m.231605 type:complete len:515 (-) Transcript_81709:165-1709(-)
MVQQVQQRWRQRSAPEAEGSFAEAPLKLPQKSVRPSVRVLDQGEPATPTATPTPRSSSPSSDDFSQRWDQAAPGAAQPQHCQGLAVPAAEIAEWEQAPPHATVSFSTGGSCAESPSQAAAPWASDGSWAGVGLGCSQEYAAMEVNNATGSSYCAPSEGVGSQVSPVVAYVDIPPAPCSCSDLADRHIVEALAATEQAHQRLLRVAHRARSLLCGQRSVGVPPEVVCVELYGSLALCGAGGHPVGSSQERWQDWARHYVQADSDVDLVVLLRDGTDVDGLVGGLLGRGLELAVRTRVRKFGTTQFTLRSAARHVHGPDVWLDLTCIDSAAHFDRFKARQGAFRQAFRAARGRVEAAHGVEGALAFDAYVFLLKGFAATVPSCALSGFQATCLGLFAVQLQLYQLKGCPLTALVLFECFLRFCVAFFGDSQNCDMRRLRGYRCCAIDISLGGRLLPRLTDRWRCEVYLLDVEVQMQGGIGEWMNVAHSVVPEIVHEAARATLSKTLCLSGSRCAWA